MTDDPDTGVPLDDSPELNLLDLAALRCLQVRMMTRDVAASGNAKARAVKAPHLEQFVSETSQFLATVEEAAADCGDVVSPDDIIASVPRRAALVDDHPRACQVLIELMVFNPWPDGTKWDDKTRQDELAAAARDLRGATLDDLETLNRELAQVMKQLRRKSIRWGRVAAVTAVGLGAGVVTGGMAAPAIGAAIGGTLGLSGAAATSAGLAALGGGSLAAGGFGVAGGTMLVSSVGGLAAAGVAGTSMRFSRLGSGNIAVDAVKLDLLARAVFTRLEDRDQKMRRVVESLHLTANDLAKKANLLSERIVELEEQNRALRDENSTLRARVAQVRSDLLHRDDEIDRLRAELETIRRERDTVDVVLDRLPAMVDQ
ncbi:hypothetical protein [Nocardia nova]|uniref:hypothetical protein n=1 Tax=Nocardia nova TaxID=37330 RepID=UPI0018933BBE|nr:hypothetical protein [Nocardia nova]MBF6148034.1 hypothetical protein [Nocardia nova]